LHANFHSLSKDYAKFKKAVSPNSTLDTPPTQHSPQQPSSLDQPQLLLLSKPTFSLYQYLQVIGGPIPSFDSISSEDKGCILLYIKAHRLLLRYESVLREIEKLTSTGNLNGTSTKEAVDSQLQFQDSIQPHHRELAKDAIHLLSMLKRYAYYAALPNALTKIFYISLLGASANVTPIRFIDSCFLCHQQNELYDENCQERCVKKKKRSCGLSTA